MRKMAAVICQSPLPRSGQNCYAYAPQFSQIIIAALFVPQLKPLLKIGLRKFGIKKHGFRQIKNTAYIHTGIDKDHAQHRVGHGQEMKN